MKTSFQYEKLHKNPQFYELVGSKIFQHLAKYGVENYQANKLKIHLQLVKNQVAEKKSGWSWFVISTPKILKMIEFYKK